MTKKSIVLALVMFGFSAFVSVWGEPGIYDVVARQRFPWNGKVDITYKVKGGIAQAASDCGCFILMQVKAKDENTDTEYVAKSLSGDTSLTAGQHTIVWDMEAEGIKIDSDKVIITVSIMADPKYCVIDISSGQYSDSYPVSYLTEEPEGGFNVLRYKKDAIVLKLVSPGSFIMGQDQTDESHRVTLTKGFYMGVFPITAYQYLNLVGSNPSQWGDPLDAPVNRISYTQIRGSEAEYSWPQSSEVNRTSVIGKLRSRTKLNTIDLPTEAQWEYTCRAGTTTKFSFGEPYDARYLSCQDNCSSHVGVGEKLPNPWGFYDMHGNSNDWCLDVWEDPRTSFGVDPVGPETITGYRTVRGGTCYKYYNDCTSYSRSSLAITDATGNGGTWSGIRLVINP